MIDYPLHDRFWLQYWLRFLLIFMVFFVPALWGMRAAGAGRIHLFRAEIQLLAVPEFFLPPQPLPD